MANHVNWCFELRTANEAASNLLESMYQRAEKAKGESRDAHLTDIFESPQQVIEEAYSIPKWSFIEEHDQYQNRMFGQSAWSAPDELFDRLMEELFRVDENVSAVMRYDDECLEFVGAIAWKGDEVVYHDHSEFEEIREYAKGRLAEKLESDEPVSNESAEAAMRDFAWDYLLQIEEEGEGYLN